MRAAARDDGRRRLPRGARARCAHHGADRADDPLSARRMADRTLVTEHLLVAQADVELDRAQRALDARRTGDAIAHTVAAVRFLRAAIIPTPKGTSMAKPAPPTDTEAAIAAAAEQLTAAGNAMLAAAAALAAITEPARLRGTAAGR